MVRRGGVQELDVLVEESTTKYDVGCKSTYDNERLAAFVSAEVDVQIHGTYRVFLVL